MYIREHISETTLLNFTEFTGCATYDRGSSTLYLRGQIYGQTGKTEVQAVVTRTRCR